ncbi:hypothetical protein PAF15_01215 [Weissella koreensis]|uniref:hypothetical protein n=1 Tax=Weissella koreensis TaxID=165096 RepID=UPI0022BA6E01|nr:hypothetical protein [Weissella koreensis]MCZ9310596.1 hypothetical protein [Weissella koreensis]
MLIILTSSQVAPTWITLISALGVGSIIGAFGTYIIGRRNAKFNEFKHHDTQTKWVDRLTEVSNTPDCEITQKHFLIVKSTLRVFYKENDDFNTKAPDSYKIIKSNYDKKLIDEKGMKIVSFLSFWEVFKKMVHGIGIYMYNLLAILTNLISFSKIMYIYEYNEKQIKSHDYLWNVFNYYAIKFINDFSEWNLIYFTSDECIKLRMISNVLLKMHWEDRNIKKGSDEYDDILLEAILKLSNN